MAEESKRRGKRAAAKPRKPKLLCVDDEPFILDGLRLNLRKAFDITTESDSVQAISRIRSGERFDVVISDMRMPKADGAEVLAAVRETQPKTVRVLLTGHADIDAAMRAVNEGKIARYVTKPVEAAQLQEIIVALLATSKEESVTTDVLQRTVGGIVRTLADILAILNPAAFGHSIRLRRPVRVLADAMGLNDPWEFEIAALLSKLGCVALPRELLERRDSGMEITKAEERKFREHPEIASKLVSQIPRFEGVTAIIRRQRQALTSELFDIEFRELPRSLQGAVLIQTAQHFIDGNFNDLHDPKPRDFDPPLHPDVLAHSAKLQALEERRSVKKCKVDELSTGMRLEADVLTLTGVVIARPGQELTYPMLERIRRFAESPGLTLPITVSLPS